MSGADLRKPSRRCTIGHQINDRVGENIDKTVALTVWKNTNRQMYWSNPLYRKCCVLCNEINHHLVSHYGKQHPEHEVVIARLSPTTADSLCQQNQRFEMSRTKITGLCYFCEKRKEMTKSNWSKHILTHTGEKMYKCRECDGTFKIKAEHSTAVCGGQSTTIYALNSENDAALTGFMCNVCNYLQINQQKIITHLLREHGFDKSKNHQYFDKVWLIPDMTPVKTIIKFDYVESYERFKCTICSITMGNVIEFEAHFIEKHNKINEYTCFCNHRLKFQKRCPPIASILLHLRLHSAKLYQCILCDEKSFYSIEDDILNHLSINHADEQLIFQHVHRKTRSPNTLTEISIKTFHCNMCNVDFHKIADVADHFSAVHGNDKNDANTKNHIKVTILEKRSQIAKMDSHMDTIFSSDTNQYVLHSAFQCTKCKFQCTNNKKCLMHNYHTHQMNIPEVKMGNLILRRNNATEKFDHSLVYSCYWCYQNDGNETFITGNVEAIYKHWQLTHTEPTFNSFKFYVETLGKCYYCNTFSTYRGLIKHTETNHAEQSICFVDVNNHKKCFLCNITNAQHELPKHFESAHSLILEVFMVNPCHMNTDLIQQLRSINVLVKHQCSHCDEIYDTIKQYEVHHSIKHKRLQPKSIEIHDNTCTGLFVDCCQSPLQPQEFCNHLNTHNIQFPCETCQLTLDNIQKAVHHDRTKHNLENSVYERWTIFDRTCRKLFYRTKVFFGNGLVLYKQNLIGSMFDDFGKFAQIMEQQKIRVFDDITNNNNSNMSEVLEL